MSLSCYAASEEDVNIFEGGTYPKEINASVTQETKPTDIKPAGTNLKTVLTNGVFDDGNNDRFYVQKPQSYTTKACPLSEGETTVNGVSFVFKFADGSNNNNNPGVKRLVFYAGAASTTNDGTLEQTLDPSQITVSLSNDNSTYTKLDFTADNFTYYPSSYYYSGKLYKKGMQVLTLNLKEETNAKFISVTIKQSAAFRIREVEAYGTTGDTNSIITGSTLDTPHKTANLYPKQTLTLNLSDDAAAQDYTYIVAKYDQDGKLTYVECKQKDESTYTVTFNKFTRDSNENIKVFIWNGFNNLIPASESYNVIPNASVK